ncbi:MAG: glycosidase [bacterium]
MKLKRVSDEPVLKPRKNLDWEKDAVFNCGAHYENGIFYLLYRAVTHHPGDPNRSYIGYAESSDGINFKRLEEPVLSPGMVPEESQGVEDPRITKINNIYYMLYTAYDSENAQVALATSKDLKKWERKGIIISKDLFGENKDAALFPQKFDGKYVVMHRPHPDIYISYSEDLFNWENHTCIMEPEYDWESEKIGGGATPIKTEKGWLIIYHGVDKDLTYRLGIALLDLKNPAKVIKRQKEPILEPELDWELKGDVNNVVFSCGAVLIDKELWVYYGGADTVIGAARADISSFLEI